MYSVQGGMVTDKLSYNILLWLHSKKYKNDWPYVKSQQMSATPELYLKKSKPFFKVPHFNDTEKPISIPNQRLLIIPKLIPSPLKKISNYISMNRLYQELIFVKNEYRITEQLFCSLILHQTDENAKNQVVSIIQGEIYDANLEDLLTTYQIYFFNLI